jgi:hypothetical protein
LILSGLAQHVTPARTISMEPRRQLRTGTTLSEKTLAVLEAPANSATTGLTLGGLHQGETTVAAPSWASIIGLAQSVQSGGRTG